MARKTDKTDRTDTMEKTTGSRDEQVGFHKGALSTLAKERQELSRIIQIVEQLMHMHIAALQELGVDLQKDATMQAQPQKPSDKKKPIDEVL